MEKPNLSFEDVSIPGFKIGTSEAEAKAQLQEEVIKRSFKLGKGTPLEQTFSMPPKQRMLESPSMSVEKEDALGVVQLLDNKIKSQARQLSRMDTKEEADDMEITLAETESLTRADENTEPSTPVAPPYPETLVEVSSSGLQQVDNTML